MPPELLRSQFETLEPLGPQEEGVVIPVSTSPNLWRIPSCAPSARMAASATTSPISEIDAITRLLGHHHQQRGVTLYPILNLPPVATLSGHRTRASTPI